MARAAGRADPGTRGAAIVLLAWATADVGKWRSGWEPLPVMIVFALAWLAWLGRRRCYSGRSRPPTSGSTRPAGGCGAGLERAWREGAAVQHGGLAGDPADAGTKQAGGGARQKLGRYLYFNA